MSNVDPKMLATMREHDRLRRQRETKKTLIVMACLLVPFLLILGFVMTQW